MRGDVAVRAALADGSATDFSHVLAAGKAATAMARAALEACPQVRQCLIVTKHGHDEAWTAGDSRVRVIEAGHPVPDENSLRAGEAAIRFVSGLAADAKLLLLVSGGASALVEDMPEGMTLADLRARTEAMLAEGLDIHAINARRKEISGVKGGKLLARFAGREALSLVISDVEGDTVSVVASGLGMVPQASGHTAMATEIIASNAIARLACEEVADALDLETIVNDEALYGDVAAVAAKVADMVRQGAPGLYVFGGEPTVILPASPGEGGRNQALAVLMARELSGMADVAVLAAGTDGSDGPTAAAGGFVTGRDWARVPGGAQALAAANSGGWLRQAGGLFVTGPTGTNVMDLMLVVKG